MNIANDKMEMPLMHKYCHISFDRLFMCHPFHGFRFFFYGFEWFPHRCPDASTHSLLLCRPAIRRGSHLAAAGAAGNVPPAHGVREVTCEAKFPMA